MATKDTGPKKFSVPTKARFLIGDLTKQVSAFVYTADEAEALNSFKNKIYPTELILIKDEAICRVLYSLSNKNAESISKLEQLKNVRLFLLAWGHKREDEESIKTRFLHNANNTFSFRTSPASKISDTVW